MALKNLMTVAITLELLALAVMCVGIGVEVATHAHLWNCIITSGAALAAMGSFLWAKVVKVGK